MKLAIFRSSSTTRIFMDGKVAWRVKCFNNIVFHGYDHLYARQELDGIVYQEVPQPGDARGGTRSAVEYGYKSGVILGSSGYLRVAVSPEKVMVDYVRVTSPQPEEGACAALKASFSYTICY
jgi:hypothetical protein